MVHGSRSTAQGQDARDKNPEEAAAQLAEVGGYNADNDRTIRRGVAVLPEGADRPEDNSDFGEGGREKWRIAKDL